MKRLSKLIALVLAMVMVISMLPVFASAEPEAEEPVTDAVETVTEETAEAEAPAEPEQAEAPAEEAEAPAAEEAAAPATEEENAPEAEEAKAEEPKAEEPKAEEAKAEEPKAEEPKAEEPKAEEPKAKAEEDEEEVKLLADPIAEVYDSNGDLVTTLTSFATGNIATATGAGANYTVKLLADVELTLPTGGAGKFQIAKDYPGTFDLNGHTLTGKNGGSDSTMFFAIWSDLTITGPGAIIYEGSMSGTARACFAGGSGSGSSATSISGKPTITLDGVTVICKNNSGAFICYPWGEEVNINNSTIWYTGTNTGQPMLYMCQQTGTANQPEQFTQSLNITNSTIGSSSAKSIISYVFNQTKSGAGNTSTADTSLSLTNVRLVGTAEGKLLVNGAKGDWTSKDLASVQETDASWTDNVTLAEYGISMSGFAKTFAVPAEVTWYGADNTTEEQVDSLSEMTVLSDSMYAGTEPAKDDHIFVGWNTVPNQTTPLDLSTVAVTDGLGLYPAFIEDLGSADITFLDANGDEYWYSSAPIGGYCTEDVAPAEDYVDEIVAGVMTRYYFVGWKFLGAEDNTAAALNTIVITEECTLVPVYGNPVTFTAVAKEITTGDVDGAYTVDDATAEYFVSLTDAIRWNATTRVADKVEITLLKDLTLDALNTEDEPGYNTNAARFIFDHFNPLDTVFNFDGHTLTSNRNVWIFGVTQEADEGKLVFKNGVLIDAYMDSYSCLVAGWPQNNDQKNATEITFDNMKVYGSSTDHVILLRLQSGVLNIKDSVVYAQGSGAIAYPIGTFVPNTIPPMVNGCYNPVINITDSRLYSYAASSGSNQGVLNTKNEGVTVNLDNVQTYRRYTGNGGVVATSGDMHTEYASGQDLYRYNGGAAYRFYVLPEDAASFGISENTYFQYREDVCAPYTALNSVATYTDIYDETSYYPTFTEAILASERDENSSTTDGGTVTLLQDLVLSDANRTIESGTCQFGTSNRIIFGNFVKALTIDLDGHTITRTRTKNVLGTEANMDQAVFGTLYIDAADSSYGNVDSTTTALSVTIQGGTFIDNFEGANSFLSLSTKNDSHEMVQPVEYTVRDMTVYGLANNNQTIGSRMPNATINIEDSVIISRSSNDTTSYAVSLYTTQDSSLYDYTPTLNLSNSRFYSLTGMNHVPINAIRNYTATVTNCEFYSNATTVNANHFITNSYASRLSPNYPDGIGLSEETVGAVSANAADLAAHAAWFDGYTLNAKWVVGDIFNVVDDGEVATVTAGGSTTKHGTLTGAMNKAWSLVEAGNPITVALCDDISLGTANEPGDGRSSAMWFQPMSDDVDLTLDLNGYTISGPDADPNDRSFMTFNQYCGDFDLTIEGDGGAISIDASRAVLVLGVNAATLDRSWSITVNNTTLENRDTVGGGNGCVFVNHVADDTHTLAIDLNGCELITSDPTFTAITSNPITSKNCLVSNGGETDDAVITKDNAVLTMTDCTFSGRPMYVNSILYNWIIVFDDDTAANLTNGMLSSSIWVPVEVGVTEYRYNDVMRANTVSAQLDDRVKPVITIVGDDTGAEYVASICGEDLEITVGDNEWTIENIPTYQMGETFYTAAYVDSGSTRNFAGFASSLRNVANTYATTGGDENLSGLGKYMMLYGAAAQAYANPSGAVVTPAEEPAGDEVVTYETTGETYEREATPKVIGGDTSFGYYGTSTVMGDDIFLKMYFRLSGDTEGITGADIDGVAKTPIKAVNGAYATAKVSVNAADFRKQVTVNTNAGDYTDSVEAYLNRQLANGSLSTAELNALAAMQNYCVAAERYFAAP